MGADDALERQIDELTRRLREREEEIGLLRLRLDVEAMVDGATGLFTRNGLLDAIALAQQRLARLREPYAVVAVAVPAVEAALADADEEARGDAARHLAALLLAAVRGLDRAGRTRGLTFALVVAGVDAATAPVVVNRLHSLLASAPVAGPRGDVHPDPRFSIVLVGEEGAARAEPDEVLRRAETSVREARPGRPHVVTL